MALDTGRMGVFTGESLTGAPKIRLHIRGECLPWEVGQPTYYCPSPSHASKNSVDMGVLRSPSLWALAFDGDYGLGAMVSARGVSVRARNLDF
jgi:hypothetical protein